MAIQKFQVVDSHLTQAMQGFSVGSVIYNQIFPTIQVANTSGKFIKWNEKAFRITSSRRAMGADVKFSDADFDRDSYVLPDGYTRGVSVDMRADQQTVGVSNINLLQNKLSIEKRKMEHEKELEAAGIITNVANFTNHGNVTNSGSGGWSDSNANIFGDIEDKKEIIAGKIGTDPDTLFITRDVWRAFRKNVNLQKQFPIIDKSYGNLIPQALADLFELKRIIVGTSTYVNESGVRTNIYGSAQAVLFYQGEFAGTGITDPSDLPPSFGFGLQLKGKPEVRKGFDDKNNQLWAVVEDNWLMKQASTEAAYYFQSVLT